jgi:hypothetical protein
MKIVLCLPLYDVSQLLRVEGIVRSALEQPNDAHCGDLEGVMLECLGVFAFGCARVRTAINRISVANQCGRTIAG